MTSFEAGYRSSRSLAWSPFRACEYARVTRASCGSPTIWWGLLAGWVAGRSRADHGHPDVLAWRAARHDRSRRPGGSHFSPSPRPRSRWPGLFGWHARVSQRWRSPASSYAWRCCWLRRLTGRLTSHSEILAAVRPRRCGKASPDQPVAV